jgi:hypothetical protein
MVVHHIDVNDLAARSDEVIFWLHRGDSVFITRCGPVIFQVSLTPAGVGIMPTTTTSGPPGDTAPKKRILGLHPGTTTAGPDFNDPLPESFWSGGAQ